MADNANNVVPVWTLATREVTVPPVADSATMTPERLSELRTVLAVLADSPIATLEAHPLPQNLDRGLGIHLDCTSPLATHLSQLISRTSHATPGIGTGGEALYLLTGTPLENRIACRTRTAISLDEKRP